MEAYKIHSSEAAMSNFAQVSEELLRVFFKEQLRDLGVLEVPCPAGGGHAALAGDYLAVRLRRASPR